MLVICYTTLNLASSPPYFYDKFPKVLFGQYVLPILTQNLEANLLHLLYLQQAMQINYSLHKILIIYKIILLFTNVH